MRGVEFVRLAVVGFGVFESRQELELRDRQLTIIVGDNQDTRAALSNGAGKSTVFKAISWALYQRTIDGLTTDVMHRRARSAEVQLECVVDGHHYRVTRRRTRTTGRLDLHRFEADPEGDAHLDGVPGRWVDHGQARASHTQEAVEALIGMSWDAFRSCVLFGQGDHARFASATLGDAARKAVLTSVLGLERYAEARERARLMRQRADAALQRTHGRLAALDGQLRTLQTRRAFLDGQRQSALDARTNGAQAISALDARLAALDAQHLTALEAIAARSERLEHELDELRARSEALEHATLHSQRADLERLEVTHALEALSCDGPCPTCGQHRLARPDQIDALEARLEAHQRRSAELQEEVGRHRLARDHARTSLSQTQEELQALRERLAQLRARRDADAHQRRQLVSTLDDVEHTLGTLQTRIAEADDALARLDLARRELDSRREDLLALQRRLDVWLKGFGPRGVPALAIEQSLPVLNQRANRHLFELGDGDLSVRWTATGERTDGGEKEELTQHITVEGLDGVAPSGGQMRKIELATEVALAEIAAESIGRGTNLVLFDEVLDGLDAEGTRRVSEWMEGLPFASIFLVSHDSGATDGFDNVVTVTKRDGAAVLSSSGPGDCFT